ncbi:MAG: NAD(+) synthase, partial [Clostridia bacterium]|nr:NAD(+) synthase [Clostridia bacterium]
TVDNAHYQTAFFSLPISGGRRKYAPTPFVPTDKQQLNSVCEKTFNILAYGLKKRIEHVNVGKLVIGISGGSDSTLALLVAKYALTLLNRSASDIVAITMPCFGTTKRTLDNSLSLISAIGATPLKVDITASVKQHLADINHPINVTDVVYENAQARERTQVLMDIANGCNGLVLGTGDMSELALGWCTYNGDQMSMYGVNSSVPKTLVKALIKFASQNTTSKQLKTVLCDILDTPISPELLPVNGNNDITQVTEDIVGPYELHDYFLFMLIRKGFTPAKVFKMAQISFEGKYDDKTIYKWLNKFIWRFFSQQFKRSASPDGVRLGSVDLSKAGMTMPSDACANTWISNLATVEPK